MKEFRAALLAFAKLVTAFVDAGGVQTCVELWRQKISESKTQQLLAERQRVALALHERDAAFVESDIGELLSAAAEATGGGEDNN